MNILPTPDPTQGLFETLLVRDGAPVELDAHLARLSAGLAQLFGTEAPAELSHDVRERARGLALGRLRIVVGAEPEAAVTITTESVDPADVFPGRSRGARLQGVRCDGGLGPHKWADRSGLDAVTGPALPLLFDRGVEVLEASRASIFVAHRWALYTPPADGRILPGIARAGVVAAAAEAGIEVEEKPLTRADLFAADELFLTGSVRGVEPVHSLDGEPLPEVGELGRRTPATQMANRPPRGDRFVIASVAAPWRRSPP
jgi:para-aminobenzoate synthetase/4-amino-4-deoxychorismate lyase